MLFEKGILLCCNGFRFEQLFLFLLSHVSLFLFPELEILLIEIYPKEDMSFDLEKQHDNLVWLFCNIKKAVLNCNSSTSSYILYETQKKVLENLNFVVLILQISVNLVFVSIQKFSTRSK